MDQDLFSAEEKKFFLELPNFLANYTVVSLTGESLGDTPDLAHSTEATVASPLIDTQLPGAMHALSI